MCDKVYAIANLVDGGSLGEEQDKFNLAMVKNTHSWETWSWPLGR